MNLLDQLKELKGNVESLIGANNVWIEVFKPDCEFVIPGVLVEGYLKDNKIKLRDKLCIRYNWDFSDYVDIEVYSNHRSAWYRLNPKEFSTIKYFINNIE